MVSPAESLGLWLMQTEQMILNKGLDLKQETCQSESRVGKSMKVVEEVRIESQLMNKCQVIMSGAANTNFYTYVGYI